MLWNRAFNNAYYWLTWILCHRPHHILEYSQSPLQSLAHRRSNVQMNEHMKWWFFLMNFYFIYFWLCCVFVAARGLSLVAASSGYSSLRCAGFLLQWLLLLRSMGSRLTGFSSCGTRAWLLRGMWDLPGPGIESMSPAIAGRSLTTAPPGKSRNNDFFGQYVGDTQVCRIYR